MVPVMLNGFLVSQLRCHAPPSPCGIEEAAGWHRVPFRCSRRVFGAKVDVWQPECRRQPGTMSE